MSQKHNWEKIYRELEKANNQLLKVYTEIVKYNQKGEKDGRRFSYVSFPDFLLYRTEQLFKKIYDLYYAEGRDG